ncbi:uncharacterized protein LOC128951518 [Oppia nitens]|uniref:uncharacterized protein LOC128951518 n=1 Tax=Oppia nitens TaxID=1686743 RepID=UPI0023D9D849|nr:uncharacterized protein LOC128951518 [Oppia nitens]
MSNSNSSGSCRGCGQPFQLLFRRPINCQICRQDYCRECLSYSNTGESIQTNYVRIEVVCDSCLTTRAIPGQQQQHQQEINDREIARLLAEEEGTVYLRPSSSSSSTTSGQTSASGGGVNTTTSHTSVGQSVISQQQHQQQLYQRQCVIYNPEILGITVTTDNARLTSDFRRRVNQWPVNRMDSSTILTVNSNVAKSNRKALALFVTTISPEANSALILAALSNGIILKPCGHTVCDQCVRQLAICHICRQTIRNTERFYLS